MSLFGFTTTGQEEKLALYYDSLLRTAGTGNGNGSFTAYGGFYVLGGLYRQGNAAAAEEMMRRLWSQMVLKWDDTMWEFFATGDEPRHPGTLSHAWGTAPTYYMSTNILGVRLGFPEPADPSVVRIEPQAESISWAEGDVPHPKGTIHVEWHVKGENLFVTCSAPKGVRCSVNPRGKLARYALWVNGEKN
jgi:alpha-L-rhamnosidase